VDDQTLTSALNGASPYFSHQDYLRFKRSLSRNEVNIRKLPKKSSPTADESLPRITQGRSRKKLSSKTSRKHRGDCFYAEQGKGANRKRASPIRSRSTGCSKRARKKPIYQKKNQKVQTKTRGGMALRSLRDHLPYSPEWRVRVHQENDHWGSYYNYEKEIISARKTVSLQGHK